MPALQNAENVEVMLADSGGGSLRDIFFNMVDPENCPPDDGVECTGHPALQDVEVRQALAKAVDKQQIIDVASWAASAAGASAWCRPAWATTSSAPRSRTTPSTPLRRTRCSTRPATPTPTATASANASPGQDCPTGDLTFRFNYPR